MYKGMFVHKLFLAYEEILPRNYLLLAHITCCNNMPEYLYENLILITLNSSAVKRTQNHSQNTN